MAKGGARRIMLAASGPDVTIVVINFSVFSASFGDGARVARLVRALAQNGCVVRIISADKNDVEPMTGVAGVSVTVPVAHSDRRRWSGLVDVGRWYVATVMLLRDILRPGDVCIVGQNSSLLPLAVMFGAAFHGAKVVHWSADYSAPGNPPVRTVRRRQKRLRRLLYRLALRRADVVVAPTAQAARVIETTCRIQPNNIALIERPLQPTTIRPIDAAHSHMRREWGLQSEFIVGCCCQFLDQTNVQTIFDAASRLARRPDIVFVFIGDGAIRSTVEAETRSRALANIRLPPLRPSVQFADCITAADIHLVSIPSVADPYAMPDEFFPIAAAGRPMIHVGDPDVEIARVIARAKCGASVQTAERLQWWIEDLRRWTLVRADMGLKARTLFDVRSNPNTWLNEWRSLLSTLTATPHEAAAQLPRRRTRSRSGDSRTPSRNPSSTADEREHSQPS
jgi:glycosyltransferase involved in cell wall biosynthesis